MVESNKTLLYVVIVLYKTRLEDSITYKTWSENVYLLKDCSYQLLIYNNSPEVEVPASDLYTVYVPTANNMLAGAYNYALIQAYNLGCTWLLLIDQDTTITQQYVMALQDALQHSSTNEQYSAIVPVLKQGGSCLSPVLFDVKYGPFHNRLPMAKQQDVENINPNHCVVAFNSLSLLSVKDVIEIGGFSEKYPLDMLDYDYFYKFYKRNKKVKVLPVEINHSLSLNSIAESMSLMRFEGYIKSKNAFAKELGFWAIFTLKYCLFKDFCYLLYKRTSWNYLNIILKGFFSC